MAWTVFLLIALIGVLFGVLALDECRRLRQAWAVHERRLRVSESRAARHGGRLAHLEANGARPVSRAQVMAAFDVEGDDQ